MTNQGNKKVLPTKLTWKFWTFINPEKEKDQDHTWISKRSVLQKEGDERTSRTMWVKKASSSCWIWKQRMAVTETIIWKRTWNMRTPLYFCWMLSSLRLLLEHSGRFADGSRHWCTDVWMLRIRGPAQQP